MPSYNEQIEQLDYVAKKFSNLDDTSNTALIKFIQEKFIPKFYPQSKTEKLIDYVQEVANKIILLGEYFKQRYGLSLKDMNYDCRKMIEAVIFEQGGLTKGYYVSDQKEYEKIRKRLVNKISSFDKGVCDYLCEIATSTDAILSRRNFLHIFPDFDPNSEHYKEEAGKRSEKSVRLLNKLESTPAMGNSTTLINLANLIQLQTYELFKRLPFSTLQSKIIKIFLRETLILDNIA